MRQILIKDIETEDWALFYQLMSELVGDNCTEFEIETTPYSETEKVLYKYYNLCMDENNGSVSEELISKCIRD